MNHLVRRMTLIAIVGALVPLGACSTMSARTRDTAIGAAAGAVAGSVLTSGNPVGVVGGAVVGGVIGDRARR